MALEELDGLYREVILDHYQNPRHSGVLPSPDIDWKGFNPLCGDEVKLQLSLKDGKVDQVGAQSHGCAISVASASMMTEVLKGKTMAEAKTTVQRVRDMFTAPGHANLSDLGDIDILEGVKKFPVRIKCALLAWTTLEEALMQRKTKNEK